MHLFKCLLSVAGIFLGTEDTGVNKAHMEFSI